MPEPPRIDNLGISMFSKNSPVNQNILTQLTLQLGSLLYTNNLIIDSRKATNKSIFCAYPGTASDGRNFIDSAIDKGVQFILWEKGIKFNSSIPNYAVDNLMLYVGLLASAKYDYPTTKYTTIGVTGTNGKTSITHWLNQAYLMAGKTTGIIGTTGAGIYPNVIDYESTTPDPITLQSILSDFAKVKADMVALEVSSHSLDQGRVNGINFTTAIFTNLTQDHLDYHKNMENYYIAKRDLFLWDGLKNAVINTDDEYGMRLNNELSRDTLNILDYGINSGSLRAKNIKINISGMSFDLIYLDKTVQCQVAVVGKFNVYNLLAVAGSMLLDGYTLSGIANLFSRLTPVHGRMDAIILEGKPLVVVDYSHTPDSLLNALTTLKEVEHSGLLYCVFGCGGNRDNTKRQIMGGISSKIADYTIVTSDNPRFEEPEAIISQITKGITNSNYQVITNRADAIKHAIEIGKPGDIILIAGKGHETYQEIKGVKHDFSDFDIARQFLKA